MAELTVTDVRVRYGDVLAVDGVSFHLASGTTLALLGPSGCGKSTLLGSIAGFVGIESGTIALGGRDVADLPVRKRGLSMVFQTHALFPHLSVLENVLFGLRARRRRGRLTPADRQAAAAALALVRLTEYRDRYPEELSGGQRQRVALARALVVQPAVLLLDEPLSSLDAKLRAEMRIELRELQAATGVTMVYVTHDKDEAFALGDLVGVMNRGKLVQLGPPEQVCREPRDPFVASFLTDANLLPGRVRETGPDGCTVVLTAPAPEGAVVGCRNPHGLPSDAPVLVAVRPRAVRVGTGGRVPARIRFSQFMGDSTHVVAEAGGCDVLAELDPVPVPVGGAVTLDWADDDAVALPPGDSPESATRRAAGRPGAAAVAVPS
ncbi:iron(III) transport system ATP-binding protein/putative spermidine/putrescine transport system ATP-binding protein/spermidine/putrescine transport system ATP-binding protein [Pseudonocardia thermophila]|uniref:ABC-type quaternary amine transporter n=1 Tax=Pseudonocardia thermophila TaxID=1848 RepID=A0A1M6RZG4_PSETH|nr:ABC transporter ATP-binding protein [Pseudonocardia thermophila]SHK37952.1 iron(III) transport system ATP-binding protein/putative spermidine/putrescine transport system ATP-binding protein/spermidine/putrescine transport system ATP-binding protein [Pseudonocardia thermophila]